MKKLLFLFTTVLLCLSMSAQSQIFRIGDYGFTNTTSAYAPLAGDSTVAFGAGTFDSGITDSIAIGFVFRFGNRFFQGIKMNSNGWMTFNMPTVATTTTTPISTAATVHIIAPFARDLDSAGTSNPARVSILRDGVAPNRIFKMQWNNFKAFGTTIVPARASFQVWIYETSNIVELRYGSVVPGTRITASTVQVGLKSGSTAADSVRTVQGASWPTATVSNTTTAKTISPTDLPDSNRLYRFTPVQQVANNVTVIAIVSPLAGTVLSNCPVFCIAPKATIRNLGSANQTTPFPITYQITGPGAPYTSTKLDTLSAGGTRTITFDSTFCPSVVGLYNITVFTSLPGDSDLTNDTLRSTVSVVNPGAGGGLPANCNYFWANSLPCSPAPSKPIVFWRDTVGATSLVVNNVQQNAAAFTGSLDDGYWRLEIPGPDQFRFCGVAYDSFFVTTNGMIGLSLTNNTAKMDDFTTQNIPSTLAIQPGLFPLWKDFNWGAAIVTTNRISYKTMVKPVDGLVLVITFDRAPNFGATLATDYVSFQVTLQLAPTPVVDGRIVYEYDDSRSGAEFLNKYYSMTLDGQTVGIQDVTGALGVQYRRSQETTPPAVGALTVPGPLFGSPVAVAFGPDALVLPVELASFTSTVNRRDVTLDWTTTRENNNSGFDIERAVLNGEWSKVGFVQGNGTSTSSIEYSFTDRGLNSGKYNYRLKQIDFNGNFEYFNLSNEVGVGIPTKYDLAQNYPNPFNPTTKINYDIPFDGKVSVKIFDISGREVSTLVNEVQPAGYYTLNFNGANLSSGAYFYRISAEGNGSSFVSTKKMMLVK